MLRSSAPNCASNSSLYSNRPPPRGTMSFGSDFTDNPAATRLRGGEAFATFLLGIPDGGEITSLNNIVYNRQIYAVYALDDFKVTPRLHPESGSPL